MAGVRVDSIGHTALIYIPTSGSKSKSKSDSSRPRRGRLQADPVTGAHNYLLVQYTTVLGILTNIPFASRVNALTTFLRTLQAPDVSYTTRSAGQQYTASLAGPFISHWVY